MPGQNRKRHVKRKRLFKRIFRSVLLVLLCTALLSGNPVFLAAEEDDETREQLSVHVKNDEIEPSTLVIGSHLIHISALTDSLYEIAQKSASDFNQDEMYYKSELAGGSWFLVSSAASIEDISTSGEPVEISVIENLEFTHHTKSDGITYDLLRQEAASIFDIPDPYDLEGMEELEPLRNEYRILMEKNEDTVTYSDNVYKEMIADFFLLDLRDDETKEWDKSLKGLQNYRNTLIAAKAEAALPKAVELVMGSVDAKRRVKSLSLLAEKLELLEVHAAGMSTEEEKEERARKKEIAESAREESGESREDGDYETALEILEEAFQETQLEELKEDIREARVEKAIQDSEKALQRFEEKEKAWREELLRLPGDIEEIESEIEGLEEQIDNSPLNFEKWQNQLKAKKTEQTEKENRKNELDRLLQEDNLSKEKEEALAETGRALKKLYEETKDERLYDQLLRVGQQTKRLKADPERDDSITVNSAIVTAIGQCIENVETSLRNYEGKILQEGSAIADQVKYRFAVLLESGGKAGDNASCDTGAEGISDLSSVLEDKIVHGDRELALLDNTLVREGARAYSGAIAGGVSEAYRTAIREKASRAVLKRYLEVQQSETNALRLEYQTFLSAKTKRMENGAAQAYMLTLIDGVKGMEERVAEDAAAPFHKQTLADHLAWLKGAYTQLVKEAAGDSDMEKLKEKQEELVRQKRDALDRNDLAGAKKADAAILAKEEDIALLEEKLTAVLSSDSASEAEKAKAAAGLSEGSGAAVLMELAAGLIQDIRDGNTESVKSGLAAVEAMKELAPRSAQNALAGVQEAIAEAMDREPDEDTAAALSEALEEAGKLSEDLAAVAGDSDGQSGEDGGGMSREQAERLLKGLLGASFEELSDRNQAGILVAVEWYAKETGAGDMYSLAGSYARKMQETGNPFIYDKLRGQPGEYASLKTVAVCLSYRYIFDDAMNNVTLEKGMEYYSFTDGKEEYLLTGDEKRVLKQAARRQETIYIPKDGCEELFSCNAEYITLADAGVLVTPVLKEEATEIYEALLAGGTG